MVTAAVGFAAVLVLVSCAGLHDRPDAGPPAPTVTTDRYLATSADAVIGYAASLAGFDAAERAFECHRVLKIYRVNRRLPILIHLFIAQTASSGCGDLRSTTREVRAMRGQIANSMVRDFVTFQLLAAGRQSDDAAEIQRLDGALHKARSNLKQAMSRHRQSISQVRDTYRRMKSRDAQARQLKQQVDELKSVEQGLSQSVRSRDAEARQLKEKLDALKSIEREINETERREDYE